MTDFTQVQTKEQFTWLFDQHWEELYLYAVKITGNKEDAQDIVQDLFAGIWIKRKQISVAGNWQNYLVTATRNKAYNVLKTRKPGVDIDAADETLPFRSEATAVENKLDINTIYRNLDQLTAVQRLVFILYRLKGFSVQEIADKLSISENTVKTHIQKSTHKIRTLTRQFTSFLF